MRGGGGNRGGSGWRPTATRDRGAPPPVPPRGESPLCIVTSRAGLTSDVTPPRAERGPRGAGGSREETPPPPPTPARSPFLPTRGGTRVRW